MKFQDPIAETKNKKTMPGSFLGAFFLKTAANAYLNVTHSYSIFSLGTYRDYSQLHRISSSGSSQFLLDIFANLYCLYLGNKSLFRKSGSVTLHQLSPSSFIQIQKREQICLAISAIWPTNYGLSTHLIS